MALMARSMEGKFDGLQSVYGIIVEGTSMLVSWFNEEFDDNSSKDNCDVWKVWFVTNRLENVTSRGKLLFVAVTMCVSRVKYQNRRAEIMKSEIDIASSMTLYTGVAVCCKTYRSNCGNKRARLIRTRDKGSGSRANRWMVCCLHTWNISGTVCGLLVGALPVWKRQQ